MKLIDGGRAPNPRRVRIFLAEKGIDVPVEAVDLAAREHLSEEFRRINPMARVPVLILDDGTAIAESMAICRYFEALHPEPALFGRDAREQALVEMWNRRMELGLLGCVAAVFRHLHPAMAELEVPQVPAWGEANRQKAAALLGWLDGELAGRRFVAGEAFSVADVTAFVALDLCKPAKLPVPEDLTHVARWRGEVAARPSAGA